MMAVVNMFGQLEHESWDRKGLTLEVAQVFVFFLC